MTTSFLTADFPFAYEAIYPTNERARAFPIARYASGVIRNKLVESVEKATYTLYLHI